MFFVSSHLLWATSHLFQEESQVIRDESKDYGVVDESSSEQQIRESANYYMQHGNTKLTKLMFSPYNR